ncbi:MAG: nuclear transport factor 2 family protein [Gammaproteobacteria bacterium]|nr:nuclear transport factor 2 family protein [Gammaproteobacteria bacterium]
MSVPVLFDSPDEAERAFYTAFEQGDLEAMMQVWDEDDDIVCVHPMGECLNGEEAVAKSWQEIFESGSPMRFEVTQRRFTRNETLSVHCVTEHITHGPRFQNHSTVIATNVYKKTPFGWRMVVHHASPGSEETEQQTETVIRTGRLH